ncbi:MAG TPA: TetR/AcrR family transcriptional regulator [Microthrixaceae bacterium]|nr:TetR/AcrR family transcriptional regulator [Microthrixaceae bacterium]
MTQSADPSAPLRNAKGNKLNRRGRETRERVISTAIEMLAGNERGGASANLVAKTAGVTWGTVQHQFGDADGLWAAVLDEIQQRRTFLPPDSMQPAVGIPARIRQVVEALWDGMATPEARAVSAIRNTLPVDVDELTAAYPQTAERFTAWDRRWRRTYARAFDGLEVDPRRLEQVRELLPPAVRGLRTEHGLSTWTDIEEALEGLVGAATAYLTGPLPE